MNKSFIELQKRQRLLEEENELLKRENADCLAKVRQAYTVNQYLASNMEALAFQKSKEYGQVNGEVNRKDDPEKIVEVEKIVEKEVLPPDFDTLLRALESRIQALQEADKENNRLHDELRKALTGS